MSGTNDPQLVIPEETKEVNKRKRPFWVSLAAIVFGLFSITGGCTGVQHVLQIGTIDWAKGARLLDTDVNTLKWMTYIQEYGTLALCIFMLVLCMGMWSMKKWGAVMSMIMAVISLGVLILSLLNRTTPTMSGAEMVIFGLFVLIGVGQIFLWRKETLS